MVTYQEPRIGAHALFRPRRRLAKDLVAAREFYHDKLGLEIATEDENAIVFTCGGGVAAELRARGVTVEDYDIPGLRPPSPSSSSSSSQRTSTASVVLTSPGSHRVTRASAHGH